ncbi:MAG: hypothetical protein M1833_005136 [Piccolia ochrophora]|nr:MAG: hypothetical protein M1833_005136 [Piccolia ochrophora]
MAADNTARSTPWVSRGGYPRPLYFVCRENGDLVPLVATDELPPSIALRGAPRFYTDLQQTVGMQNLGMSATWDTGYELEDTNPPILRQDQAPASSTYLPSYTQSQAPGERHIEYQIRPPTHDPSSHSVSSSWEHPVGPFTGVSGDPGKEYCTHWIFHGECAFTHSPRGCKFKHEMPLDREGLAKVGLKDVPKWWLERYRPRLIDREWRPPVGASTRLGGDPAAPFQLPAAPSDPHFSPKNPSTPRTPAFPGSASVGLPPPLQPTKLAPSTTGFAGFPSRTPAEVAAASAGFHPIGSGFAQTRPPSSINMSPTGSHDMAMRGTKSPTPPGMTPPHGRLRAQLSGMEPVPFLASRLSPSELPRSTEQSLEKPFGVDNGSLKRGDSSEVHSERNPASNPKTPSDAEESRSSTQAPVTESSEAEAVEAYEGFESLIGTYD